MENQLAKKIMANPRYQRLVEKRSRYSWFMTALMLIVYYGFILLIAFNKPFLSQKISEGNAVTLGIPIGLGVIFFTIIITGIYVRRANSEFDEDTRAIIEEVNK